MIGDVKCQYCGRPFGSWFYRNRHESKCELRPIVPLPQQARYKEVVGDERYDKMLERNNRRAQERRAGERECPVCHATKWVRRLRDGRFLCPNGHVYVKEDSAHEA